MVMSLKKCTFPKTFFEFLLRSSDVIDQITEDMFVYKGE